MTYLRTMRPDTDGGPKTGTDDNMLGAHPRDVKQDSDGNVRAGRGISVARTSVADFPPFLKPIDVPGGVSEARRGCFVFELAADDVPAEIEPVASRNSEWHYELAPRVPVPLAAYQATLASTRASWTRVLP